MIYGYIRVSTDKQTFLNQKFEIEKFCADNHIQISGWIEETISGTTQIRHRKLGRLLKKVKPKDIIICSEISRLGRNLFMIMSILHFCLDREIYIWTIKDGYRLGNDISSKVLAFAFGLSAEIERNLISQRTKEALHRKRAEGQKLGRPFGSRNKKLKLAKHRDEIIQLLRCRYSRRRIAEQFNINRKTLDYYINSQKIKPF